MVVDVCGWQVLRQKSLSDPCMSLINIGTEKIGTCAPCTCRAEKSDNERAGKQRRQRERGVSNKGWNLLEAVLETRNISNSILEGVRITSSSSVTTAKEIMEATCFLLSELIPFSQSWYFSWMFTLLLLQPYFVCGKSFYIYSGSNIWMAGPLQMTVHPEDREELSGSVYTDK